MGRSGEEGEREQERKNETGEGESDRRKTGPRLGWRN